MSVEELIRQLEKIEDKRKQVLVSVVGNVSYNYPTLVVSDIYDVFEKVMYINVVESR